MRTYLRCVISFLGVVLVLGLSRNASAQADPYNYLFNTGQNVQPFFEGWARNPDGSFEMHFGYLNRNYVEELEVPIGPGNRFTSGASDQGQPTFFYPRIHHRVFSVTVPADWGDRELVWSVTVRDKTAEAVAWLQAEWEIDPVPRAAAGEGEEENQAPTMVVDADETVTRPAMLTMRATVSDDGLPEPRTRAGGAPVVLPTFEPDADKGPTVPVNVPQIQADARSRPIVARVERVTLTWTQWRGPAGVTLEAEGEPEDGVTSVTAAFEEPGEYVFRVQASDGPKTVTEMVAVTIR